MNNLETIHAIANQLAAQGKTPSVALVKAKLSSGVPLPQIINAMKSWQYSEPKEASEVATEQPEKLNELTQEQQLEALVDKAVAKAISPLMDKLNRIETLLKQQE